MIKGILNVTLHQVFIRHIAVSGFFFSFKVTPLSACSVDQFCRSTCGASMEQILANSTWPDRANRMCILKVENHIIHSKSAVSCRSVNTGEKRKLVTFFIPPDFELKMLSYHFPPKVVPSWLHAGFKRLSVCIGWKSNERKRKTHVLSLSTKLSCSCAL